MGIAPGSSAAADASQDAAPSTAHGRGLSVDLLSSSEVARAAILLAAEVGGLSSAWARSAPLRLPKQCACSMDLVVLNTVLEPDLDGPEWQQHKHMLPHGHHRQPCQVAGISSTTRRPSAFCRGVSLMLVKTFARAKMPSTNHSLSVSAPQQSDRACGLCLQAGADSTDLQEAEPSADPPQTPPAVDDLVQEDLDASPVQEASGRALLRGTSAAHPLLHAQSSYLCSGYAHFRIPYLSLRVTMLSC